MAKVLVINLLHAWKYDTSTILFSLRNSLLFIYKTCKVYVLTLLFLGIYIPIFFSLGGILLMVFPLLLGSLPVLGGYSNAYRTAVDKYCCHSIGIHWLVRRHTNYRELQTITMVISCCSSVM
jgi:hypothetical protein